ncbi:MAG: hypothetical protein BWY19_00279 [bacterium ADurb.Bin212]|nr:MAG: hypothetical protein BWY19_00279 [bacterium ADurb.Bin212]
MLKKISTLRNFILEIVSALVLSLVLFYQPETGAANLFIVAAFVFLHYLMLSRIARGKLWSLMFFFVSTAAYLLCLYFNLTHILIVVALICVILSVYYAYKMGINSDQRKITQKTLVLGLAISLLLPLVFSLSLETFIYKHSKESKGDTEILFSHIDQGKTERQDRSKQLSKDQFIIDLFSLGRYEDLSQYIQNLMVMNNEDIITLCNLDERIVARSDKPRAVGDDCKKIMPGWQSLASESGIIKEEEKLYLVAISEIITANNEKVGYVITGKNLRSYLLEKIGTKNDKFYFSYEGRILPENDLLLSDSLFRAIKEKQLPYNRDELYSFEKQYYLITNNKFADADSGLIYLHEVSDLSGLFWLNLIIVYAITIVIFLLYRIKYADAQSFSFARTGSLFRRSYRKIRIPDKEYLLEFAIVSALVVVMSKGSFDKQLAIFYSNTILPATNEQLLATNPRLNLYAPSYVGVNDGFTVLLSANDLKSGINTISATIVYNTENLSFEGVNILADICDEVYDNNIDQNQGLVHFSCVTKDFSSDIPGNSKLAEFTVLPLKRDLTYITFDAAYVKITTGHGISNQTEQSTDKGEGVWVLDSI